MASGNLEKVRQLFDEFGPCIDSRDFEPLRPYFHPDVELNVGPAHAGVLVGNRLGFDALALFLSLVTTEPTFGFMGTTLELEELAADRVGARFTVRLGDGASNDAIVFTLAEGLITRVDQTIGNPALTAQLYK